MKTFAHLSCVLLALFFTTLPASSQTHPDNYRPRCGGAFDLCGYVDRDTKSELIPRQFERAFDFSDGLAAVRVNGLFGYINLAGNVVIEPQFKLTGDFYEGLAEVLVGDVVGVIDKTGQFVVEPQFARAVPFTKDTLIVEMGNWNNQHYAGRARIDGLNGFINFGGSGVGLYHVTKGWLTQQKFIVRKFDEPRRGLIWAHVPGKYPWQYGLLRADGTWQVAPTYTHVQSLSDGLAVVRGKSKDQVFEHKGRSIDPSGAVDQDGKLVVPLQYNHLSYWRSGYGLARKDGFHGLVSKDGTLLGGRYFDEVERYEDERLPRVRDGQIWHSVTPDGTLVADENEGTLIAQCPSGLAIHERSGLAEFSHPNLTAPIPYLFEREYRYSSVDCGNPVSVEFNGSWGYVTQAGQLLTDPPTFDSTYSFEGEHTAVSLNGLWGIIDRNGAFTVAPTYDRLDPYDNIFRAEKGDLEHWIDAHGNAAAAPVVQPESRASFLACAGGLRLFAENDLWGMKAADDTVLIAPTHRALSCFSQGVAWAAVPDGTAWCPIGPDGKTRQNPSCRASYYPYSLTHHFPEKFAEDEYEDSVLWVRAYLDYGRNQRDSAPVWVSDGVMGDISWSFTRN